MPSTPRNCSRSTSRSRRESSAEARTQVVRRVTAASGGSNWSGRLGANWPWRSVQRAVTVAAPWRDSGFFAGQRGFSWEVWSEPGGLTRPWPSRDRPRRGCSHLPPPPMASTTSTSNSESGRCTSRDWSSRSPARRPGPSTTARRWFGRSGTDVPTWARFELDGPAGHIQGLSLRLYNPQSREWNISFSNGKDGALTPPMFGRFSGRRGEFFGQEVLDGRAIYVRFVFSGDHRELVPLRAGLLRGRRQDLGGQLDCSLHSSVTREPKVG